MRWRELPFWKSETWVRIKRTLGRAPSIVKPSPGKVMRPFQLTPLEKVKVVILTPETYSIGEGTGLGWSYKPEKPGSDPFTAPFYFYSMMKELWEDQGLRKRNEKCHPTETFLRGLAKAYSYGMPRLLLLLASTIVIAILVGMI